MCTLSKSSAALPRSMHKIRPTHSYGFKMKNIEKGDGSDEDKTE
jgi:hypothetical protein